MSTPTFVPVEPDAHDTLLTCFVAAGASARDCALIAWRYDDDDIGFRWDRSESWLVRAWPDGDSVRWSVLSRGTEWLTRLWCSPQGTAWACGAAGSVLEATPAGVRAHKLPVTLSGIFGLGDDCVWAWSEASQRMFQWDATQWREVECPGRIVVMHGVSSSLLFAGGYEGWLWRWDGLRWRAVDTWIDGTITGLHTTAARDGGGFACTLAGEVVELSPYGEQVVTRAKGPLLDVACVGDRVLFAAGQDGMLWLAPDDDALTPLEVDFAPERFDVRGDVVLVSTFEGVVETRDGAATFGPALSLATMEAPELGQPPMYRSTNAPVDPDA